jgi:cation:H+ antiporter
LHPTPPARSRKARTVPLRDGVVLMAWLELLVCSALILWSGSFLSRYGDMLAEKTGMGRTWIGLILLSTVTSLPELVTGLSSVTVAGAPDLAVGDVLGSCVFNLMLIGLVDLFYRPSPLLSRVNQGHILSAGLGILLIGIAAWGLALGAQRMVSWPLWFGPTAPLILLLYGMAIRRVFQFERRRMAEFVKEEAEAMNYAHVPLQTVYRNVAFHAGVMVGAGAWLPFIGKQIAASTGLDHAFVGNLLIAASTSLPEIVITFAAVRLAAPDLAVANLFGSNLFNMAILALDDMAYVHGPLLFHVSPHHLFSAVTALMMTGIAITGLMYQTQKKSWAIMTWDSAALLALYVLNGYLLFRVAMTAASS